MKTLFPVIGVIESGGDPFRNKECKQKTNKIANKGENRRHLNRGREQSRAQEGTSENRGAQMSVLHIVGEELDRTGAALCNMFVR